MLALLAYPSIVVNEAFAIVFRNERSGAFSEHQKFPQAAV
jgi:hypothetical protein